MVVDKSVMVAFPILSDTAEDVDAVDEDAVNVDIFGGDITKGNLMYWRVPSIFISNK